MAQVNYKEAIGRDSVRCVSCNTTGLTRIVGVLRQKGLLKKVRAVLFRRETDPWKSHKNGLINTVVPEKDIPSHQGQDVKTILPGLVIITIAATGPFNLSHLHTIFGTPKDQPQTKQRFSYGYSEISKTPKDQPAKVNAIREAWRFIIEKTIKALCKRNVI